MAIELALAIEAVSAVWDLVRMAGEAAAKIHPGWRGRNANAKRELQERVTQLHRSLEQVAALARAAEAYSRVHEQIVVFLQSCKRTQDFVNNSRADLTNRTSGNYDADWRVLDKMFDSVKANLSVPRSVLLDRAEWYDTQDKSQIDLRLNDFNAAFRDASKSVQNRFAGDATGDIASMISPLEDVDLLLRSTMYDKIFRSLESVAE